MLLQFGIEVKRIDSNKQLGIALARPLHLQNEKVNWFDAYKRSYRELTRIFFKDPKKAPVPEAPKG